MTPTNNGDWPQGRSRGNDKGPRNFGGARAGRGRQRRNVSLGDTGLLTIGEKVIRTHGPGHVLKVCWRQWRSERRLARRGIRFRTTDRPTLAAAYAAMSAAEFDAVNGRQDWANWRTIPRALNGHVPDRPLTVVDLGCGSGGSTRILAFYCPRGSHIIGYELAGPLLDIAGRRKYLHRSGDVADVAFVTQDITQTWCRPDGRPLADRSVNVINASGVVGHHLYADTVRLLITEARRVLVPGGIASLDVGPTMRASKLTQMMTAAGFRSLGRYRSCLFDPNGQVVFRLE